MNEHNRDVWLVHFATPTTFTDGSKINVNEKRSSQYIRDGKKILRLSITEL